MSYPTSSVSQRSVCYIVTFMVPCTPGFFFHGVWPLDPSLVYCPRKATRTVGRLHVMRTSFQTARPILFDPNPQTESTQHGPTSRLVFVLPKDLVIFDLMQSYDLGQMVHKNLK